MIRIGVVGDMMPGGALVYEGGVSSDVRTLFSGFDLRVANLECAFGDGSTLCHIKMSDPSLGNIIYAPDAAIRVLKDLNINVVSLANNHSCDLDLDGLSHTIELLDANGIAHFGAGRTADEATRPAVVQVKGKQLCFLGYFPPQWEASYPPDKSRGGLNHFYIDKVISDIRKYSREYDYVFVMPHWGVEHTRLPCVEDVENARRMLSEGAVGVFGSHAHITQAAFSCGKGIVAMNLGNFIFPDRWIKSPRLTCYPSEEERAGHDGSVTWKFPIVNGLTYKRVPRAGRIGLVCDVAVSDSGVGLNKIHTMLDFDHVLKIVPCREDWKVWASEFALKHDVYSVVLKLLRGPKRLVRKVRACFNIPSRIIGKANALRRDRKARKVWYRDFEHFKVTAKPILTKKQKNDAKKYFAQYGFNLCVDWHDYYTSMTGVFSEKYIPADLMYTKIVPYLNYMPFEQAYQDKGVYSRLLPNVRQPECVVQRIHSFYYSGNGVPIEESEAVRLCSDLYHCIIKPTVNSCQGRGVKLFSSEEGRLATGSTVKCLFESYGDNFIVQKRVVQHPFLASLNESSLNTMRVLSLRIGNEIKVLSCAIRIGGRGSITDNGYGGGFCCGLNPDGSFKHIGYRLTTGERIEALQNGVRLDGLQVPSFEKVLAKAKELHMTLPYLRIIGWDFTIDTESEPVFIEMNTLPGIYMMQLCNGPVFGELTDEILKASLAR